MENAAEAPAMPPLPPRPAHVPAELVRPYPFAGRGTTSTAIPRDFIPEIHQGPPVFWVDAVPYSIPGAWVPRRYAELQQVYQDTEHFTPKGTSQFAQMIGETWFSIPGEAEPPLHSRYRLVLNPMFGPSRMAKLEERIRLYARELLLELRPRGGCEFVSEFAFEFPIRVFLELMGLPQDNVAQFLAWEHAILRSHSIEPVVEALKAVTEYLSEQCEQRRREPKDDLLTLGVQAEVEGRKLTEDELKGFCFNLFVGGLDTVSTNLSAHFRHLAENPDHQQFLRENPDRIPEAIDELMRAYAAVTTLRVCTKEIEVGGARMLPGDLVLMPTFLAANDPEVFPRPEIIDLARKPRHVSFGYGPHLCIGMHLAKREMRIAMEEALAILPPFGIAPGVEVVSFCSIAPIGPVALPLIWNA
ncbi:cytochrome P450 [Novosphingobium sp. JCM 18896]|uniref:cytochrome P450 n=1 Tax=Novosphingobium sp. JCM 18896 TaxID=2989731 RepID=UPI002222B08E|nr:cytochrome P450 [Novosphingobium sp. JCM 18896]MCW1429525.1 cytochrome P450 [Novosphingobium sp. JCM 18896]